MQIRESLLPLPKELIGRPIDHRGFPVPWFVSEKTPEGLWDFVHIHGEKFYQAVKFNKCFVSGEQLGKYAAFVVGPMCTINRIASDPPCKPNVGMWSATHCPFLTNPSAKRPGGDHAFVGSATPGLPQPGNPGVTAVWITKEWEYNRDRLFQFGEPDRVLWYTRGRLATVAEAREGFEIGAEKLMKMAVSEGAEAEDVCRRMVMISREYI
jgi:hypothetical protein